MKIKEIARDIRKALDEYRESVGLTFTEEGHRYTLPGLDRIVSVSGIVKRYHEEFDRDGIAAKVAAKQGRTIADIIAEWEEKGRVARNIGNYVHYHLEEYLVDKFELDKELRKPVWNLTDTEIKKGDKLIKAGKAQTEKMVERGAWLIDTEVVMGSIEDGYVGQCDCAWVGESSDGSYKLCLTDWKTNKPSKFSDSYFDSPMFMPFYDVNDNARGKYSLQIGLYERLLLTMLKDSDFKDMTFANSIIVSLMQVPEGKYKEYALDDAMRQKIYLLDV